MVEELVPTQEDMENDVFVQTVNHSQVGIRDGEYPLFNVQAYMAEHQRLVGEHKDLLSRVSILEDDMRILKANSVHGRENIPMPSSVESEAGKAEENDDDGMKLYDEDVAVEEKKGKKKMMMG